MSPNYNFNCLHNLVNEIKKNMENPLKLNARHVKINPKLFFIKKIPYLGTILLNHPYSQKTNTLQIPI